MTTAPLWTLCRRTLGAAFLIAAAATFVASTAVAQEAEPTFASANSAYQQGRYAEAAGQLEQLAALKGWSAPLLYDWANAQARQGALGAALLGYRRAALLSPRDPDITANLAHAYVATNRKAEAVELLNDLKRSSVPGSPLAAEIAMVYAALGDKDQAMTWLEKGYEERFNPGVLLRPCFDPLRSDSRFQDLVRHIGLPL